MSLLIVEPLEAEVVQWLAERHAVHYAPELASNPQALRAALAHVQGLVLPPHVPLDGQLLRQAPRLRVVARMSAGPENIDVDACRAARVEVVRSLTATASAEAEFVVGALLALLRRVPVLSSDGMLVGRELGCATVGLIGMSPAARMLAQLLPAFGTRVVGYDPSLHQSEPLWAQWGIEPLPLRELMEQSDGVSVQLAYFLRYRGLIGERVLGFAKPGQVLVSIAHSAVFDEQALADAMSSGRVLAAWFDSLEPGLLEPGRPLHGLEGVQVTPRLASTTRESRVRAAWGVARRMDELLTVPPPAAADFRATYPADLPEPALASSRWR
ncbi:MAG: NAD(P)-dependent oxidoreductase [Roseateles asaccharophilus]|jgi:phosphoglycerate dehydrogenase-like enzyme|uniref:D-3-phosphoglycerate dehydrogenase/(S)-sulfolactate dehydrogenase n=1 Tax=Roseateles asaccharophilus TaxID=582607 RepID=A0A4R6N3P1_9BURK|nr:NAD(P)-dependent oxidoreductase [Roseateles asaccharophilus]MDN3544442.1 NAD(P)-dependent oxidoreductase [Roseateles asaccharophilus]TDP09793.1 D-3-phosphoglycerate dehydrogenase/(S)-sulfolactate dehydrogenase [Roseateles asaccharophilus]